MISRSCFALVWFKVVRATWGNVYLDMALSDGVALEMLGNPLLAELAAANDMEALHVLRLFIDGHNRCAFRCVLTEGSRWRHVRPRCSTIRYHQQAPTEADKRAFRVHLFETLLQKLPQVAADDADVQTRVWKAVDVPSITWSLPHASATEGVALRAATSVMLTFESFKVGITQDPAYCWLN